GIARGPWEAPRDAGQCARRVPSGSGSPLHRKRPIPREPSEGRTERARATCARRRPARSVCPDARRYPHSPARRATRAREPSRRQTLPSSGHPVDQRAILSRVEGPLRSRERGEHDGVPKIVIALGEARHLPRELDAPVVELRELVGRRTTPAPRLLAHRPVTELPQLGRATGPLLLHQGRVLLEVRPGALARPTGEERFVHAKQRALAEELAVPGLTRARHRARLPWRAAASKGMAGRPKPGKLRGS